MIIDPCELIYDRNHKKYSHAIIFCPLNGTDGFIKKDGTCPDCGKLVHPNVWTALKFKEFTGK